MTLPKNKNNLLDDNVISCCTIHLRFTYIYHARFFGMSRHLKEMLYGYFQNLSDDVSTY